MQMDQLRFTVLIIDSRFGLYWVLEDLDAVAGNISASVNGVGLTCQSFDQSLGLWKSRTEKLWRSKVLGAFGEIVCKHSPLR